MIKEISIIKAFDDYREAMDYTKTILEDVVLLTMHGENDKKLHGPISKVNIQEIINLFEKKEWVGLTDKEVVMLAYQSQENECNAIRLAEAKLKEKNS